MPKRSVHIVSFDVPYPADYGGVIDVFYKIKALAEEGVEVKLHCFQYGRQPAAELEKFCAAVHYYERSTAKFLLFSHEPYIVASRRSDALLQNLLVDDAPVIFEGLHCCALLDHPALSERKKIVRTHNIEHEYYRSLAEVEMNLFRRNYFFREAKKLERFEKKLSVANHIFAISPADAHSLSERYAHVENVMAFHAYTEVNAKPGYGNFALYHGNLEVGENNLAALFLVEEVFNDIPYHLIIAGNNPSRELQYAVMARRNITLKTRCSPNEIDQLVSEAHVNVLPTFQSTGIKLKLLAALFHGRHCLVNEKMVDQTGLEPLCSVANTAPAMKAELSRLFKMEFREDEVEKRKKILTEAFSNRKNAGKIILRAEL